MFDFTIGLFTGFFGAFLLRRPSHFIMRGTQTDDFPDWNHTRPIPIKSSMKLT
jgi:hypothetical protein